VEQWIIEARAGSRQALNRLLNLCQSYLLATAQQEIGTKLRVRVSPPDLVQNTLLEAYLDFDRFQGRTEADLLAWLRQVLRHNRANEVRRHIRTAKRCVHREVSLAEVASDALPYRVRPDTGLSRGRSQLSEQGEILERTLRRLPEHYRHALVLHTCDGLTFAEVGEKLGCSAEAARKLWSRAAEELRTLLAQIP
jgi:RNA polymerase sigma-70 factor (ECF subfamily)